MLTSILMACAALSMIGCQYAAGQNRDTVARTIKVGELNRTCYLHVPANLLKDKAVALVLVFHGGGGTPAYAERETKFSELADREGFIVAYPEGLKKSWNDGRGEEDVPAQHDKIDDLAFIAALIDDVSKDQRIDGKKVFSTGISNGAIFSYYLAVNLSSSIAAIAPVAGGLPKAYSNDFKPEKPVSVLIFHGTDDPLVHYNGGDVTVLGKKHSGIIPTDETISKWVERDGCNRDAIEEDVPDKDAGDGCRVRKFTYAKGKDGTEVVLYRIEGGGHTWPDGKQYLPKMIVGPVCHDINATAIIWEFFKAHPKP
ncbi:MAG: PHB depolymerase family esterase [Victivallales bacterium]